MPAGLVSSLPFDKLSGAAVTGHWQGFRRLPSISCIVRLVDVCAHAHVCAEPSGEQGKASACLALDFAMGY